MTEQEKKDWAEFEKINTALMNGESTDGFDQRKVRKANHVFDMMPKKRRTIINLTAHCMVK